MAGDAAIYAVAAEIAVMFMGSTLLTPLYVLYKQAFSFSEITLTLIYSVYVVGNLAALLFLGRLSDEVGRRPVSAVAFAVAGLSTLIFLVAGSTAPLYVGRALSGLAVGLASGTGTAWVADLHGKGNKTRATVIAATANMLGISLGPLVAGVLAEYAPAPLQLSFLVYLAVLAVVAWRVWRARETVERASSAMPSLRPRVGVPSGIRLAFAAPAITVFAVFAFVGFYAALIPSLLGNVMHISNIAVGGLVAFEMFGVGALTIPLAERLASRTAMISGLIVFLPSLLLLGVAEILASLPFLLVATAIGGVAAALGYRGSLQVVNKIAPAERRAEVVSAYFAIGFAGNALPVIGVGVLSSLAGYVTASMTFAVLLALLALAAIGAGMWFTKKK